VLLFIGIYGVLLGTLVLIAGQINRTSGRDRTTLRWLFLYVSGMNLVLTMIILMEYTSRVFLHSTLAYILMATLTPIMMCVASKVTQFRFAATAVAGWYTFFLIALIQILPLFPAEPKLGPVYQHVTQFIPPQFPILLVVPGVVLDLLWARTKTWNAWLLAIVSATLFVCVLIAVEWPFAAFLMTPAARNEFFGTGYLHYGVPPQSHLAQGEFYLPERGAALFRGLITAILFCSVTMRWGFSRGTWLRNLQR
jgi:hypothetical protein